MKSLTVIILAQLFLMCSSVLSQSNLQDIIHLKNGSIVRGTIIEQVPNETIKIKTNDGNIFVFKMSEIQKIVKDEATVQPNKATTRLKSPLTAFALSFLYPGIGQFYNGDVGQGFLHLGINTISLPLFLFYSEEGEEFRTASTILLGVWGVNYIWALIQAPTKANKINNKIKYGHAIEFQNNQMVYGMDMKFQKNKFTTNFTVHF